MNHGSALSPPDLANAVTSFATIFAGASTYLLCRFAGRQPWRWERAYLALLLTGFPTLGWHGWQLEAWRVADVGTNLILAYALQLAVLGDFYPRRAQQVGAVVLGGINAAGIGQLFREAYTGQAPYVLQFGSFGGFQLGELVLIFDSLTVFALFVHSRQAIPARALPLLRVMTVVFLCGLLLATAAGTTVHARVLSYHALWHIVGAFGFIFLWAMNHMRFAADNGTRNTEPVTVEPLSDR